MWEANVLKISKLKGNIHTFTILSHNKTVIAKDCSKKSIGMDNKTQFTGSHNK